MRSKKFGSLLSEVNRILEQLAEVYEQEVAEATSKPNPKQDKEENSRQAETTLTANQESNKAEEPQTEGSPKQAESEFTGEKANGDEVLEPTVSLVLEDEGREKPVERGPLQAASEIPGKEVAEEEASKAGVVGAGVTVDIQDCNQGTRILHDPPPQPDWIGGPKSRVYGHTIKLVTAPPVAEDEWEQEAARLIPSTSFSNSGLDVGNNMSPRNISSRSVSARSAADESLRGSILPVKTAISSRNVSARSAADESVWGSSSMLPIKTANTQSLHKFQMRKPWADLYKWDTDIKLSDQFTTPKLLQSRKGRRCSDIPQTRQTIKDMRSMTHLNNRRRGSFCAQHIVSHPESKGRGVWVLTSLAFLMYDLAMAPVVVCFNLATTHLSAIIDLCATVFWTSDIIFNFFTGVQTQNCLVMEPLQIAFLYVRSYFLFDVFLVVPEWITLAHTSFPGGQIAVIRVARWGRLMRLLRLARLMRVLKLKPLLVKIILKFHVSSTYMQVTQGWIGIFVLYTILMHVLACLWYAFGRAFDHGWIAANGYESASATEAYIVSVHWSISRLSGLRSDHRLETAAETLLDTLLIYASFILASFFAGTVTAVCMTRVGSRSMSIWKCGMAYIHRHDISPEVDMRLLKVLDALNCGGAGEIAVEEATLLEALPVSLQQDLLFEARVDSLLHKSFFKDMALLNERVVMQVCLAMCSEFSVEREVIFAYGETSDSILFITSGTFWYVYQISPWEVLEAQIASAEQKVAGFKAWTKAGSDFSKIIPLAPGMEAQSKRLVCDAIVSEPALWTLWEHTGSLLAAEESTALSLDAARFAEVIVQHTGPRIHMVRYAKHFVWHLNNLDAYNDLTEFPHLTIQNLDEKLFAGTQEDHFIFISHYKLEAGTEATLMRDQLEPILRGDLRHPANELLTPIFIDSEDLSDLARLKEHVKKSSALVLLLTPGVLYRPWVLIEIVTASTNGVNIVPVEVQRRGDPFSYPHEEFYGLLSVGKLLDKDATDLLRHEGIHLEDVEQALRDVFLKIALPFSPHKMKSVREAELVGILKRCGEGQVLKKTTCGKNAIFKK